MLDGPIDREEDMENGDKNENKDLEQENEELKVENFLLLLAIKLLHCDIFEKDLTRNSIE